MLRRHPIGVIVCTWTYHECRRAPAACEPALVMASCGLHEIMVRPDGLRNWLAHYELWRRICRRDAPGRDTCANGFVAGYRVAARAALWPASRCLGRPPAPAAADDRR